MHIQYERSGGFGGLHLQKSFDTHSLPAEVAQNVHNLVDASDFFALPQNLTNQDAGADRFQYKITIEDQDRDHTVEAGEAGVPDQLWPLLHLLDTLARSRNL